MIFAVIFIYIIEWVLFDFIEDTQSFLLLSKYLLCAVLSSILLVESKNELISYKSIIAIVCLDAWAGFIQLIIYDAYDAQIDLSLYVALVFLIWFIFILKRKYPERIDLVNLSNVNILILKPKNTMDVIKGLIGMPAASICLIADSQIWCFRKESGKYESSPYCSKWASSHLVIDTHIENSPKITNELNKLVGKDRFPFIKCVWIMRNVLTLLGDRYIIRNWFYFIPGIYFMMII